MKDADLCVQRSVTWDCPANQTGLSREKMKNPGVLPVLVCFIIFLIKVAFLCPEIILIILLSQHFQQSDIISISFFRPLKISLDVGNVL